jgi:hypothetical protein
MVGVLNQYLAEDHNRLDGLLQRATANPGRIDMQPYSEFRKGLLRHISMEEKIVLPVIARLQSGVQAAVADRIRLDHGALVALLAPSPSASIIATLRSILDVHNALEEQEGGLYHLLDQLAGAESDTLLLRMKSAPEVPVLPHNERPEVIEATRRAVARAGYEFRIVPG